MKSRHQPPSFALEELACPVSFVRHGGFISRSEAVRESQKTNHPAGTGIKIAENKSSLFQ
jgi:hypothetical protein